MLEVRNLSYAYDTQMVLNDISFTIDQGAIVGILGLSGSGKTTLLKILSGLLDVEENQVILDGEDVRIKGKRHESLANKVGVVFQQFDLFMHLSVIDNISLAYRLRSKVSKEEASKKALNLLTQFGLDDQANKFPDQCSGGQQQRIAIARALILEPEILLIDEPTSSLDKENTQILIDLLKGLYQEKLTIVLITHDLPFAQAMCQRVIELKNGFLSFDDDAYKYFNEVV